jgi:hypothetical protein
MLISVAMGIFEATLMLPRQLQRHFSTERERAVHIVRILGIMTGCIVIIMLLGISAKYAALYGIGYASVVLLVDPLKIIKDVK